MKQDWKNCLVICQTPKLFLLDSIIRILDPPTEKGESKKQPDGVVGIMQYDFRNNCIDLNNFKRSYIV